MWISPNFWSWNLRWSMVTTGSSSHSRRHRQPRQHHHRVVTDTFGVRTLIRPSEQTVVTLGEFPWSMFKLSGNGMRSDFIMLAPTLGLVQDVAPLEEVMFLRDNMAAMAWAIEHKLPGDLDSPVDGQEAYLQRLKSNAPPAPPQATANGPQVYYTVEQPVPDNWIPLLPVQTPQGSLYLRRGTMEIPTTQGLLYVTPRALVLIPASRSFSPTGFCLPPEFLSTAISAAHARPTEQPTFGWRASPAPDVDQAGLVCASISCRTWPNPHRHDSQSRLPAVCCTTERRVKPSVRMFRRNVRIDSTPIPMKR